MLEPPGLPPDRGVGEVDLEVDRQRLRRRQLGDDVALDVPHRLEHADRAQRARQAREPGAQDRLDEAPRRCRP